MFATSEDGTAHIGPTALVPDADATEGGGEVAGGLALFTLALGVAGTLLGITVVWFFAAIPLGCAAIVTGWVAQGRSDIGSHRARAVIGMALGLVAVLLGVLSAILLPKVVQRAERSLTNTQADVFAQIDKVDRSWSANVDQLDAAITRELRHLEHANHREISEFLETSTGELRRFERRLAKSEKDLPAGQRLELARMGQELRAELVALESSLRGGDSAALATIDAISARVHALEVQLGVAAPPAAGPPAATGPVNAAPTVAPTADAG